MTKQKNVVEEPIVIEEVGFGINSVPIDEIRYTKAQLVGARIFQGYERDILRVVLNNNQTYTITEARQLIDNFLKGVVN